MVDDGRYEAILKHVHASAANVDGRGLTPVDVLGKLVGAGKHDVALKYVHKFKADGQFPPAQLVEACLKREGELTVRTCGMLLKFVPKFNLEDTYPIATILERVQASGIIVHRLNGAYVLKGRRRVGMSGGSVPPPARAGSAPN